MKMKKIVASLALLVLGVVGLAGCQSRQPSLKPSAQTFKPDGIVTVVKGTASKNADLTYQIGNENAKKVTNQGGTFVIQVPSQLKATKVKLTAKHNGATTTKTVTVAKAKALASYPKFAMTYNVINQQMKTGAEVLPMQLKDGLTDLVNADGMRIRVNVQNQQLVGVAYVFSVNKMKSKTEVKKFAMQLVVLSNSVGADGKQVLKDYQKLAKKAENGQTTVDNIHSKGVTFETNFSTKALYMYLVKK
ncbi:hypothetical protein [Lapidilactobacillus wuchangensis]|uniref:hypothetical protein n=1 Tax=Lapidilactobacillus wuchangensis TaxID=2486001 RepID=UPI000F78F5BF|nr:hypothetical protein [Lapidilactobacillus wuchangensis]